MRAISLYCELAQGAILDGLQAEVVAAGGDVGAAAEAPVEPVLAEAPAEEAAEEEAPVEEAAKEEASAEKAAKEEQASA
jgi:small subunit ribosomal protein S2